jgi:hypothetical protein
MHYHDHYKLGNRDHVPVYLRHALTDWIENDGESQTCEYDGEIIPLTWVLGMLWIRAPEARRDRR